MIPEIKIGQLEQDLFSTSNGEKKEGFESRAEQFFLGLLFLSLWMQLMPEIASSMAFISGWFVVLFQSGLSSSLVD